MKKQNKKIFKGYLPKELRKYRNIIEEAYKDDDGIWVYVDYGYYTDDIGLHLYHEDNWSGIVKVFNPTFGCTCEECKQELTKRSKGDENAK
jgi:hypothetical protein